MTASTKNCAAAEKQKTREGEEGKRLRYKYRRPKEKGLACKIITKFNILTIAFTPVSRNSCLFHCKAKKNGY